MAASFRPGLRLATGLFVALLAVGACASAASPAAPAGNDQRAPVFGSGTGGNGSTLQGELAGPTAAPAMAPDAAAPQPAQVVDQPLVVKTGTMSLQVPDIGDALPRARAAIAGVGGYVSASDESNQGDQQVASITYRIPAARWDDALDALTKIAAKVLAEQTNAVEVTGQVLDLGARISNLRATEAALQAIMARATRISDVLEVQQQLTDVRGQIEQLSTEQSHLQQQAAYGTLTVTWTEPVVPAVTVTAKGWDPGVEIDRAAALLEGLGQGLATAGIWLAIVGLPVVLGFLVVLVPLGLLLRRLAPKPRQGWGPAGSGGGSTPA